MLKQNTKEFIQKGLLVLGAVFISLMIAEIGLRIFLPKYQEAAESRLTRDDFLKRVPNTRSLRKHPDTGKQHLAVYNNLGLRQSWDVDRVSSARRLRIGFFGDSFVENTGLSIEYGFVNVLDYLLNSNKDKFEVINFGMNGYGTDDAYLSFLERPVARGLQFVFYVYCDNDLMNIYENKLISVDREGHLIFPRKKKGSSFWNRVVSRFYITYLFLDAKTKFVSWLNLQPKKHFHKERHSLAVKRFQNDHLSGKPSPEVDQTIKVYQTILQAWSKRAAAQNARFSVVLLPFHPEGKDESLIPEGIDSLNLYKLFSGSHLFPPSRLRFQHEGHWNEYANMLAAYFLYRDLEVKLGITHRSDEWVKQRLFEYYSAFGKEWFPDLGLEKTVLSERKEKAIWHKYKALEMKG